MSLGKFIVIEGLDGSGKSTQLTLLDTYLTSRDVSFRHVHFPRLDSAPFGKMIAEYLRGDFGSIDQVHPKLVALLFAGDRYDFAGTIREWLAEGHLVIADRYVNSNIAFQCAKYADAASKAALKEWIHEIEYGYFNIPKPDLSFFLDVPVAQAAHAITADDTRSTRSYLDGASDIHEADSDFQSRVYREYLELVDDENSLYAITCTDTQGTRLPPQDIHDTIVSQLISHRLIPAM